MGVKSNSARIDQCAGNRRRAGDQEDTAASTYALAILALHETVIDQRGAVSDLRANSSSSTSSRAAAANCTVIDQRCSILNMSSGTGKATATAIASGDGCVV